MKIAMINGSPKGKRSASNLFLQELQTCISIDAEFKIFSFNKPQINDSTLEELSHCDVLIFACPLYVDGIPSQLLSCLYQMEKAGMRNKNIVVYGIVNAGFYEGKQTEIALQILENWCNKMEFHWGMGVGIGAGGAFPRIASKPLGKGPKKSVGAAFNTLSENTKNKKTSDNLYVSIDFFPRWLYKMYAESGWKRVIKRNGGKVKDLDCRY